LELKGNLLPLEEGKAMSMDAGPWVDQLFCPLAMHF